MDRIVRRGIKNKGNQQLKTWRHEDMKKQKWKGSTESQQRKNCHYPNKKSKVKVKSTGMITEKFFKVGEAEPAVGILVFEYELVAVVCGESVFCWWSVGCVLIGEFTVGEFDVGGSVTGASVIGELVVVSGWRLRLTCGTNE